MFLLLYMSYQLKFANDLFKLRERKMEGITTKPSVGGLRGRGGEVGLEVNDSV